MNYNISPIQRDFYLECMLNPLANKKFNINMIFTLKIKSESSKQEILEAICSTVNNQPLLLSRPWIENSKILLNFTNNFSIKEIAIGKFTNFLEKDDMFNVPFDLVNDKRLFRIKLIKHSQDRYYLLMSAHHFIFDFYSAKAFSQQIIDTLQGNITFTKKDFTKEYLLTINKFLEKQNSLKYENIFLKRLSKIRKVNEKIFSDFTKFEKIEISKKIVMEQSNDNNYRSALLISAFGYTFSRYINKEYIIVGVPVPNRIKSNRKLISSLVTTYPVIIDSKWSIEECIKCVYKQLIENLKMQFYDFNQKFYQYSKFDMMFTYYPSKFAISNSSAEIKMDNLFTIDSPSPIHLMLNYDNLLLAEFQTNLIINKNDFLEESLHVLLERNTLQ